MKSYAGGEIAMMALYLVVLSLMNVQGQRPVIIKLGTIDCDLVETTPFVWRDRLWRFEWVRPRYKANVLGGRSYYRIVDVESGRWVGPFAEDHCFGCAFVHGGRVWVHGVRRPAGEVIDVFWSDDLNTWHQVEALRLPGWGIFNTSVCADDDGFVMAFEIDRPREVAGHPFTICFARSDDLLHWQLLDPTRCAYTRERYSACPSIRYVAGWYYMIYLEQVEGGWAPYIVRSRDLATWETSPFNPIMKWGSEDKRIANERLTPEQREHIARAVNVNNSDVDLCEWDGRVVINYSWGNQHGTEFLAEAYFDGNLQQFLEGWFPNR